MLPFARELEYLSLPFARSICLVFAYLYFYTRRSPMQLQVCYFFDTTRCLLVMKSASVLYTDLLLNSFAFSRRFSTRTLCRACAATLLLCL